MDQGTATTDAPQVSFTITNNTVGHPDGNGILAVTLNNAGAMALKLNDNNVQHVPALPARYGIRVSENNNVGGSAIHLEMHGNTTAGGSGITANGIGLREADPSVFGIEGLVPSPASSPNVETYVNGQNPSGHGTDILSGTGFTNITVT